MVQPIKYETMIVDCSELKLHISDGGRKCTRLYYVEISAQSEYGRTKMNGNAYHLFKKYNYV